MKTLSYILGVIAIAGSIALGVNWMSTTRGIRKSESAVSEFEKQAAEWKLADDLRDKNLEDMAHNDNLKLNNATLELQIAEMSGKSTKAAQANINRAQEFIRADKMAIGFRDMARMTGTEPRLASVLERAEASHAALTVYRGISKRDGQVAYVVGFVWIMFGFSVALARQQRSKTSHP